MPTPSSISRSEPVIAVIGGGPAGFFAAVTAKEAQPSCRVTIFEKSSRVLGKVKISGGGRCNITHDSPDPRELAAHYPRGHRELIGPFTRFGAPAAAAWFTDRGVPLRTYPDGCLFPVSNDSQTVIDCLTGEARRLDVTVRTRAEVTSVVATDAGFALTLASGATARADRVLIATGGRAVAGPLHGAMPWPPPAATRSRRWCRRCSPSRWTTICSRGWPASWWTRSGFAVWAIGAWPCRTGLC